MKKSIITILMFGIISTSAFTAGITLSPLATAINAINAVLVVATTTPIIAAVGGTFASAATSEAAQNREKLAVVKDDAINFVNGGDMTEGLLESIDLVKENIPEANQTCDMNGLTTSECDEVVALSIVQALSINN